MEELLLKLIVNDITNWEKLIIFTMIIFSKDIVKFIKNYGKYILTLDIANFKKAWHSFFMIGTIDSNDINDAISFDLELQKIREYFNAKTVTYTAYHNGGDIGYKSYSCRYEASRTQRDIIRYMFQNQPLMPFMGLIKIWEKDPVIYISDQKGEQYATARINGEQIGTTGFYVIPVAIHINDVFPLTKRHLVLNFDWSDKRGKYVVIGCINIILDSQSNPKQQTDNSYLKQQIIMARNTYLKNPKILNK